MIAVRDVGVLLANEPFARDLRHCGEHAVVANAHTTELPDHLIAIRQKIHRPNCVPQGVCVSAGPTEGPRDMGSRPEAGGSLWRREGFGRARAIRSVLPPPLTKRRRPSRWAHR